MATNFPGSLDSYTNPVGSDLLSTGAGGDSHSTMHSNLNDAVEALEAKVGANSSAVTTSHDYKIDALETDVSGATDANTASKIVKRDASGNFSAGTITAALTGNVTGNVTGDVTGDVTGNADTATALATSRTIALTGDVTASGVGFDGSGNISLTTEMANNSVDLGTHTTGNYVETVAGGDGIDVTGSDAEGATKTVAVDSTVLRGSRGADTYYPNENGYITITTGIPKTSSDDIVAAFVQTTSQTTTGENAPEYVLTLPVTAIYNNPSSSSYKQFQCRLYEVNGSGNSDYTVSTIYDSNPPGVNVALSWVVFQ